MSVRRAAVTSIAVLSMASVFLWLGLASVPATAQTTAATVSTGQAIVNAAASQAGIPYCEGGGGTEGPRLPATTA